MGAKRKSPSSDYPKKSRAFSFTGKEAYQMLDFLDEAGEQYEYGKSGLIIDLLKLYKEAKGKLGDEDTMFKLRMLMELNKNKEQD